MTDAMISTASSSSSSSSSAAEEEDEIALRKLGDAAAPQPASLRYTLLVVCGVCATGAIASICAKTLYQLRSEGVCPEHFIEKPWFTTMVMMIGEAGCLPYYHLLVMRRKQSLVVVQQGDEHAQQLHESLLENPGMTSSIQAESSSSSEQPSSPIPSITASPTAKQPVPKWTFLCLSMIDIVGSTLAGIGLLYVTASINQMLRGSTSLFTAFFSTQLLRRRLSKQQWIAIVVVITGLFLVGLSSYLANAHNASSESNSDNAADEDTAATATSLQLMFGIFLIILSSAVNSFQNTSEEYLLKRFIQYRQPHPLEVIGFEGCFGTLLTIFVVLPIVYNLPGSDCGNRQENTLDTLRQFRNNPTALAVIIVYGVAMGALNSIAMELTNVRSAVLSNLVSSLRVLLVWLISVALYYTFGSSLGEQLGYWSAVEALGFAFLVGGTVLYAQKQEAEHGV